MNDQNKITSAMEWQTAYHQQQQDVTVFYTSPCLKFPELGSINKLNKADLSEWKSFLSPFIEGQTLLSGLDVLENPESLVVITGQQVGAGMTPLLMVYKAFAALHWSKEVTKQTGRACVPVFWLASDDHDLEEIRTVKWLSSQGDLLSADLASDQSENDKAVYHQKIDQQKADQFLEELKNSVFETEFTGELIKSLSNAYTSEHNFEEAFLSFVAPLFVKMGIFPVAPRLGFVRRRGSSVIEKEILGNLDSNSLIEKASQEISALGMKPPVHRKGNEVNFFVEIDGQRGKVIRENDEFIVLAPGQEKQELARMTEDEMLLLLENSPNLFSPNALLRPLVQDAVFPTAAYIAGPTELVYHAQIKYLYHYFQIHRPAVFPRPNVVLVEGKVERALKKLGVTSDVLSSPTKTQLKKQLEPPASETAGGSGVETSLKQLQEVLESLEHHVKALGNDTGMLKAVERLKQNTETGMNKLEDRVKTYLLSQDSTRLRGQEKVLQSIFPGDIPQERAIGIIAPLLALYGPGVLENIYQKINYRSYGFQVHSLNK